MPDWSAPFHFPQLTDEEYAKRKAEYTAKYGYSITIPGLSDIIHINTPPPMTAMESHLWRTKQYDQFSPQRYEEVKEMKRKRKERYLQMLASPTPAWAQNAGSIMTAIDDAQDAISTLGCIGRLAMKVAPAVLGKYLKGPTGVLMAVSDALDLVQQTGQMCMMPLTTKTASEGLVKGSPWSKKAKVKRAKKISRGLPTKGDWIQGLQTTDQVFGEGISLGPIMGLIQDVIFASIRAKPGEFVDIKFPKPDLKKWGELALRVLKSNICFMAVPHQTDDEEILMMLAAVFLAFQAAMPIVQDWNPLDNIGNWERVEIQAPTPWHVLTQEVIEEEGKPLEEVTGWPQTGDLWIDIPTIGETTPSQANQNLHNYLVRNKHHWAGWLGGLSASDLCYYCVAGLEGEDQVEHETSIAVQAALTMQKNGYRLDPNQPYEKFELFNTFLEDCEETHWLPTIENIIEFCQSPWNNIRLQYNLILDT